MEKMYDKIVKVTIVAVAIIAEILYAVASYGDIANGNWRILLKDSCLFFLAIAIMRIVLEIYSVIADKIFDEE